MNRVEPGKDYLAHEITFEVDMGDGRVARCWQAVSQSYQNCTFSAGLVDGVEPDTLYLRFHRFTPEGKESEIPTTIFLRPDEATALMWVLAGAKWSWEMFEMDRMEEVAKRMVQEGEEG